jgi:hypothetical protein
MIGDVMLIVSILLFASSGGFLLTVGCLRAQTLVDPHEKEVTGFVVSFIIQTAILLGSSLAFLVQLI